MTVSTNISISDSFTQQYTVGGEVFNCECFLEDGSYIVDIFHVHGGELFVDSYEGDDLRSLDTYLANEVVPNLEILVEDSLAHIKELFAKKKRETAEFWARMSA